MATERHTPGPWRYIDATKEASMQYAQKFVIIAGDKQISSFSWNDSSRRFPTKDQSQANARLISAAPDLLDALEPDILDAIAIEIDCFEHSARAASLRGIAKRQRAALAKAGAQ